MKHRFIFMMFLFCFALCPAMVTPVSAENLLEVVDAAQIVIRKKYPERDSLARKMAMEELENTARCGESDERIIRAIMEKFPETSDELFAKSDLNCNGIPDDWEKTFKVSARFMAPESDEDADGFTLIQEYRAGTDPADPLSHPKYITQIYVASVSPYRFSGLELAAVDRPVPSWYGKDNWVAVFALTRNGRRNTAFVRIDGSFKFGDKVRFRIVDIEVDPQTQRPVVYLQREGKDERIPCRLHQPVYDSVLQVKTLNALNARTFITTVGGTFRLGSKRTGIETYRIVSTDPGTKETVVESVGENPETFRILPVPKDLPAARAIATAKATARATAAATAQAAATAKAAATAQAAANASASATAKAVATASAVATAKAAATAKASVPVNAPSKNAARSASKKGGATPLPIFHKRDSGNGR